jgi:hypothetical protein
MIKSDIHAVLAVLWLIASGLQFKEEIVPFVCALMFVFFALSSGIRRIIGVFKK